MKLYRKVFVAGTFDHFHVGHQWLLWTAVKFGKEMVVIIARDKTVAHIKKKSAENSETNRQRRVQIENLPNTSVKLGRLDKKFIQTLKDESPDLLYLGYDQKIDENNLKSIFPNLEIKRGTSFHPGFFKSSKFGK